MARAAQPEMPLKVAGGDTLELVARLLVGSSYRVPVEGRSSRPTLQSSDVAGALGLMSRTVAREVALAVVTRADRPAIARVAALAYRKILREVLLQRPQPLDLRKPADCWRLRMVAYDAAHDLVYPERQRTQKTAAHAAKMRKARYAAVHHCATAVLQQSLAEAGRELDWRLFGSL